MAAPRQLTRFICWPNCAVCEMTLTAVDFLSRNPRLTREHLVAQRQARDGRHGGGFEAFMIERAAEEFERCARAIEQAVLLVRRGLDEAARGSRPMPHCSCRSAGGCLRARLRVPNVTATAPSSSHRARSEWRRVRCWAIGCRERSSLATPRRSRKRQLRRLAQAPAIFPSLPARSRRRRSCSASLPAKQHDAAGRALDHLALQVQARRARHRPGSRRR